MYIITSSASAAIMNDMATVTVTGLVCEETYSIVAGGIITNGVMVDQTLDGPRFHMETILASACPVVITTTMMTIGKRVIYHYSCTHFLLDMYGEYLCDPVWENRSYRLFKNIEKCQF